MSGLCFKIKAAEGTRDLVEQYYKSHNSSYHGDCGLDLYCLKDQTIRARSISNKIHLGIHVAAFREYTYEVRGDAGGGWTPQSFYLFPRSSTGSKTPLRLSNSVGIIDSGYRGELIALVDNVSDQDFMIKAGERYFQLCAADLCQVSCRIVDTLDETERGARGFGST